MIGWDISSCTITLEHIDNPGNCIETSLSLLKNINAVATINRLSSRTVTTRWLLPTPDYDFSSLERKYRETMMTQQSIQDGALGSSVILEICGELNQHIPCDDT